MRWNKILRNKTAAENGDGPPSRARRPSVGSGRTEYARIFDILQSELQDIFCDFLFQVMHIHPKRDGQS
jgi:hypothetical protein